MNITAKQLETYLLELSFPAKSQGNLEFLWLCVFWEIAPQVQIRFCVSFLEDWLTEIEVYRACDKDHTLEYIKP